MIPSGSTDPDQIPAGQIPAGQIPRWEVHEGLTPYPEALAAMEARVAGIRAGTAA
jgi:lipoyl(octanoyl) transferase